MDLQQYTKEFRYNLHLATPVILGMLGHTLVGFIDSVMIGRQLGTGNTEFAASALGNSFIFLAMSFGVGFSTVITTLSAEAHSVKDIERGKSVLKHGVISCLFLSFFMVGITSFAEPFMYLFQQDKEIINLALPYVNLVAISLIPMMIFQAFKQFTDGLSLTKYAMYVIFCGNIINIILNYIFIYGNFGAPKMGLLGAGIGTLASRFVTPILFWYILFKDKRTNNYLKNLQWKNIEIKSIKKIFSLGIPSSLQMAFEAGVFIGTIWISGAIGKNYQSSNQIALSLSNMAFMLSAGMSVVAMIRISHFKELKDYVNLKRVALSIFLFVIMWQVIVAMFFIIFKNWLPSIFLDTNDFSSIEDISFVIADASNLILIAGLFQIADGIQVVALGTLRGMQDVKIPMIITFIAYWVIAFPICYYLGLYTELKTQGIWIGLLAGLVVAAILLTYRFFNIVKKELK